MKRRGRRNRLFAAVVLAVAGVATAGARGELATIRSGTQTAADAAALAAVRYLLSNPLDDAGARLAAIELANANVILGRTPELRPEDIRFDHDAGIVRVDVHTPVFPIPATLARLPGFHPLTVSASASAEGRAGGFGLGPVKVLRLIERSP
jgi:hypothetical protein